MVETTGAQASRLQAKELSSCSDSNPVLTIEGGKVIGVQTPTKGIIAYKGIPFAAPPVGDLRWKEPQPVVPWEGVKTADKYGDAARSNYMGPPEFLWQGMAGQWICSFQRGLSLSEYLDSCSRQNGEETTCCHVDTRRRLS